LALSDEVRAKIHEFAAGYGVRSLRVIAAKTECALCAALALPLEEVVSGAG
jgi:hypothetical protein